MDGEVYTLPRTINNIPLRRRIMLKKAFILINHPKVKVLKYLLHIYNGSHKMDGEVYTVPVTIYNIPLTRRRML